MIVGIIDTGIDYLNPEFTDSNGKTRILKIWDQSLKTDKYPKDMFYGTEYSEEEINQAIELNNIP